MGLDKGKTQTAKVRFTWNTSRDIRKMMPNIKRVWQIGKEHLGRESVANVSLVATYSIRSAVAFRPSIVASRRVIC